MMKGFDIFCASQALITDPRRTPSRDLASTGSSHSPINLKVVYYLERPRKNYFVAK